MSLSTEHPRGLDWCESVVLLDGHSCSRHCICVLFGWCLALGTRLAETDRKEEQKEHLTHHAMAYIKRKCDDRDLD